MDRTYRVLAFVLLAACGGPEEDPQPMPGDEEIAAEDLCGEIAEVICSADTSCCETHAPTCVEDQTAECLETIQPLVEDPRLGYDPVLGAAFVATLRERAETCWEEPADYDALLDMFAGTGSEGADCTPPNLNAGSLRDSALSCAGDLACRLHLRADGSTEGECEPRTDEACSHPLDCGPGQFCSSPDWRPGVWGECRPLRADGWTCESDLECASRHCDGTCKPAPRSARCLTTSYAGLVRESAPIAFWRFDEESGTSATDATGNGHDGTLSATAMYDMSGAIGRERAEPLPDAGLSDGGAPMPEDGASIRFASDDAAVRVATLGELEGADGLTFEAWIRTDSAETTGPIVEINDGTDLGAHMWCYDSGDKLFANFLSAEGEQRPLMSDAGAVSPGAWHHVVATNDGETARIYVDGRAAGEVAAAGPLRVAADLYIGHRPSGETTRSFRGLIDEVAIYDRALELREIRRHHRAGATNTHESRFSIFRWLE